MKNPYTLVREISLNNFEKNIDNTKSSFENLEKFIIWIVGFSIGGIGIIISNYKIFSEKYSDCILKSILISFVFSIFLGIFCRYAIYILYTKFQTIQDYIRLSLSNFDFPIINPEDLSDEDNLENIINRFKIDYDLDYSNFNEEFKKSNDDEKKAIIKFLTDRYNEIGKFSKESFDDGLESVREIYKIAFGLSEEKSKKLFYKPQSEITSNFNRWKKLTDASFILCSLLFFISVLLLVINF